MQKLEQKEKRVRKHDKRRRKEGAEQGEGSVPSVGPAKTVGRVVKACRRTRPSPAARGRDQGGRL